MIASDNHTVTELNRRARTDRINAGHVEPDGIRTTSGAVIGVGDHVVTRRNNRRLTTGTSWVKNGDHWTVTATLPDGSISLTRNGSAGTSHGHVTLPADYARDHVDLGYATTAHGAQGRTVDTSHSFVSAATPREALYVAATRGRDSNKMYVDTSYDPDADTAHQPPPDPGSGRRAPPGPRHPRRRHLRHRDLIPPAPGPTSTASTDSGPSTRPSPRPCSATGTTT